MRLSSENALKIVMGFISVFHLVMGFGLMFFPKFQKFAITLYGAQLDWTLKEVYFIRIVGSFAFILGILAYSAAKNPIKNQFVVIGFIEFFILRNIHRHLFANEVYEAFKISPTANILTSVFFFIQAFTLWFLLWKAKKN